MNRRGFAVQRGAARAPFSPSHPASFAVRPFSVSAPAAAVSRPAAPPVRLDFAPHPERSQTPILPPVLPRPRARGTADELPDTVDLPLETAQRTAVAAAGSPASPLPFGERIQSSFGRFDIQGVEAHLGGGATESARSLGARAYTAGEHVVFAGRPDLRTAAHEAAHVIQQRAGVRPAGGVGRPGDPHERQADAVAEQVAAGRTAEPLLHRFTGTWDASRALSRPAGPPAAVQRVIDEKELGTAFNEQIGAAATLDQYKKWLINYTGFAWSAIETAYAIGRLENFKAEIRAQRVDPDFDQDVKGEEIERRRARDSGITAAPVQFNLLPDGTEAFQLTRRNRSLNTISPQEFLPLLEKTDQYFVKETKTGPVILFRNQPDNGFAFFDVPSPQALGKELLIRYHILFDEPEPRSGRERAAANEQVGGLRAPSDTEAAYAPAARNVGAPQGVKQYQVANSILRVEMGADQIKNTMIHKGPWAKGSRKPGQAAVMGGQSAKNYAIDQLGRDSPELAGRYEWLHIIGSSLGGLNVLGNLVAGTYDANTKMIALEHRVALWSSREYQRNANEAAAADQPMRDVSTGASGSASAAASEDKSSAAPIAINDATPLTIVGTADVRHNTFLATNIALTVSHGGTELVSGEYKAGDPHVITKNEYEAEEKRVEDTIAAARAARAT